MLYTCLLVASPPQLASDGAISEKLPFNLHGYLETLYRYRSQRGETDHDSEQFFSLRFSDKEKKWVEGYISARFAQDLDGFNKAEPFAAFPDTFGRTYQRVTAAYVDVTCPLKIIEKVRLGRQELPELPFMIRFDGVRLRTSVLDPIFKSRFSCFAGIPDHLGERSRGGDRLFGGSLRIEPFDLVNLSCSYVRLCDTYRIHDPLGSASRKRSQDDLFIFSVSKSIWQNVSLSGRLCLLEGKARDAQIRTQFYLPSLRCGLVASYKALFKTQEERSAELDPYVSVLRVYRPYHQFSVQAWHDLNEKISLEAGFTVRRLKRAEHPGPFNHEFERYWAGIALMRWPFEGLEIDLIGELYETGSDRHSEVEAAARYHFMENLLAEIGTAYALFKEDRYTLRERSDVRAVFANLKWQALPSLGVFCRYTFEEDNSQGSHLLEVALRWRF